MDRLDKAVEARRYERLAETTGDSELAGYYKGKASQLRKSAALESRRGDIVRATQQYLAVLRSMGLDAKIEVEEGRQ